MIQVSIQQTGLRDVQVGLSRLEGAIRDMRPAWDQVVQYLDAVETQAFSSEGGTTAGGKWAPLKEEYRRWKARNWPGRQILELTGRLKDSVLGSTPDTVSSRTQTRLEYGTSVPYARYHQRGEGVPERAFLNLTNRQAAEIGAIMSRYLRIEAAKGFRSRAGVGV